MSILEQLDLPQNVQVNRPCQKILKFPTRKYFVFIWTHLILHYTKYFRGENSRNFNASQKLNSNIFSKIHCQILRTSFLRRKKNQFNFICVQIILLAWLLIRVIRVLLLYMGWNYMYPSFDDWRKMGIRMWFFYSDLFKNSAVQWNNQFTWHKVCTTQMWISHFTCDVSNWWRHPWCCHVMPTNGTVLNTVT